MGRSVSKILSESNEITNISAREFLSRTNYFQNVVADADFIFEFAQENLELKSAVISMISSMNDECIIGTGTSSLLISELASACKNPSRFFGIHFMNPPIRIRTVECILNEMSDINRKLKLERSLTSWGFEPIWVQDTPGFVLNSVLFSLCNAAARLVEDLETDVYKVDKIVGSVCGHPLPPLKTLDLVGIDVAYEIIKNLSRHSPEHFSPPSPIFEYLLELGYLGRKTKRGFYSY